MSIDVPVVIVTGKVVQVTEVFGEIELIRPTEVNGTMSDGLL
jgi:hypothetical protein